MSNEQPLLILQPTKKWVYSTLLSSLMGSVSVIAITIVLAKYLEDYVFHLNWFELLEFPSDELPRSIIPIAIFLSSRAAALGVIFVILCIIFLWIVILAFLIPYFVIVPFYRMLGRKYIIYEFFPKMLVVHKGIFVKTRKVYPYRSITETNHVQPFTGRFFGISILVLYEPGQIPALVDGIDNTILMKLFLEFQQLLLKRSNREMVHGAASGANLRATGSDELQEKNTFAG
ncbi:MAG: PH domain-containing protein [Candidatus Hodarchaeales archaeon]